MNRFINWLLGRKELTVVMLERKKLYQRRNGNDN